MYTYARYAVVRAWAPRTATCRGAGALYYYGSGLARGVSRRIGRSAKVRLRAEVPDPHTNSRTILRCFSVKNTRGDIGEGKHDTRPSDYLPKTIFHGDTHFRPSRMPTA